MNRTDESIASGLDDIASGRKWDGEALQLAHESQKINFYDKFVIRRYQHGTNRGTDHMKLQDVANKMRSAGMQTKWANLTAARIESRALSEAEIRKLRIILARAMNKGANGWMTGTPSCEPADADKLAAMIEKFRPIVSDEQKAKGIAWLRQNVFCKNGAQRSTEFAQQFTASDQNIIRNVARFELVGLYDTREDGARYCVLHPVYRAIAFNGDWFEYVARAWQSGGNSFITARGNAGAPQYTDA